MLSTTGLSTTAQLYDQTSQVTVLSWLDSTSDTPLFQATFQLPPEQSDTGVELAEIRRRSFARFGEAWRTLANL